MSHTLHRPKQGGVTDQDYVVLVMPARTYNNTDVHEKYGKYVDIFRKYNPVNMGGMNIGLLIDHAPDELKELAREDAPMIHAVYTSLEDLTGVLRELKEKDYGFSVVVSGRLEDLREGLAAADLQPHSYNFSLGVFGATEKLPSGPVLAITSMCGHAMIAPGLVEKLVSDIRKGKTTAHKAAAKITRPCLCGIFNTHRAEILLNEIVQAS